MPCLVDPASADSVGHCAKKKDVPQLPKSCTIVCLASLLHSQSYTDQVMNLLLFRIVQSMKKADDDTHNGFSCYVGSRHCYSQLKVSEDAEYPRVLCAILYFETCAKACKRRGNSHIHSRTKRKKFLYHMTLNCEGCS